MAEPSNEERDLILQVFLREYNQEHGTAFAFKADAPPGTDTDWICEDPGRPDDPLKLQHVRAWADAEREIVHPKAVANYVVRRLLSLAKEHNLTGYSVSLEVSSLPTDKKKREFLVGQDLWNTILHGTRQLQVPEGYRRVLWFNRTEIDHYYKDLAEHVADLEVLKVSDGTPFAVAWSPGTQVGIAGGMQRASEALRKKARHYGDGAKDIVLIIDFEVIPYYEPVDVPDLRKWIADENVPFKEVWITTGLWVNQLAHRIWPVDVGDNPALEEG